MEEKLQNTLKNLPDSPGVYIMKDGQGTVIYVGKAKVLKNRVRSYFHATNLSEKTRTLVSNIADLEYIVVDSEMEALLLENNLIKQYKPKYNILLKDDKGYPFIRIDLQENFPQITVARRLKFDKAQYFGPYMGATMAREIVDLVLDLFPLRTCTHDFGKSKTKIRPCLKYHIGKCVGPCAGVSEEAYHHILLDAIDFLQGNHGGVLLELQARMERASQELDFEKAAEYRDKIARVESVLTRQKIVLQSNQNIDVLAAALQEGYAVVTAMFIRGGRLIGVRTTEQADVEYASEAALLTGYIMQQYSQRALLPKEIVCAVLPEDADILAEILSKTHQRKVKIYSPSRGQKRELYQMALNNAWETHAKSLAKERHQQQRRSEAMEGLQQALELPALPRRIECFDISHIQGTDTVASMVVFTDGAPDKKEYRRFKIKTVSGIDDFASMAEVVTRRYRRAVSKDEGFALLPDLIVIDGGKGQLHSAAEAVYALGLGAVPMIGLAKRLEEIFLPESGVPILLSYHAPALQLLQSIRDEAHRFAITFHRSLRNKRGLLSVLEEIPGIGQVRRKALFKTFGSVERIKNAPLKELEAAEGMNKPAAAQVYAFFHTAQKQEEHET